LALAHILVHSKAPQKPTIVYCHRLCQCAHTCCLSMSIPFSCGEIRDSTALRTLQHNIVFYCSSLRKTNPA